MSVEYPLRQAEFDLAACGGQVGLVPEEVARRDLIRRAAAHLHIAPSAVDRLSLRLEAHLGVALFERVQSGLRLTAAGEISISLRRVINDVWARRLGGEPQYCAVASSVTLISSLVRKGLGIGLTTALNVMAEVAAKEPPSPLEAAFGDRAGVRGPQHLLRYAVE